MKPPDDYASAWLAINRHVKNFHAKASLNDFQAAAESAAQIRKLADELIAYCDAQIMPGVWEE